MSHSYTFLMVSVRNTSDGESQRRWGNICHMYKRLLMLMATIIVSIASSEVQPHFEHLILYNCQ